MKRRAVLGIMLTLLPVAMLSLILNNEPIRATTVTVPDDYPTIQSAINAASPGDTVYVRNGTYHEHVIVNKTVLLVGQSKRKTIIDGDWSGIVVRVTANNVLISNFTVQHSGWCLFDLPNCGIRLDASYCIVTNNIVSNNDCSGIRIYGFSNNIISRNNITANGGNGIDLYSSSHNIIRSNNITRNNHHGIWVKWYSANNTVSENDITVNDDDGIYLWNSHNINVFGNNITANGWSGLNFDLSSNNTIHSNNITVNGRNGIYISRTSNSTIHGNSIAFNQGGVELQLSSINNTISRNTITENKIDGIFKGGSTYNIVSENIISNNLYGIRLRALSDNNKITKNILKLNECALYLESSNGNWVYHNNVIDSTVKQAYDDSVNNWDDGYPSGGNYWSDYEGVDADGDGIGDTSYIFDENNQDNYPRMNPIIAGDVDYDGYVGSADAGILNGAYGTSDGNPLYVVRADFDEDGYIGSADAGVLNGNYGRTAAQ